MFKFSRRQSTGSTSKGCKDLTDKIAMLNDKLAIARELLFDGKVELEDFVIMKKDCEEKIKRFKIDLTDAKLQSSSFASKTSF